MGFKPPPGFNDFPDQRTPPGYMSVDTDIEWLMQPYGTEPNPEGVQSELFNILGELVDNLDVVDYQMIRLIFYEGKTFQEAATACGLKAKSYAWRKTNRALTTIGEGLKSNPKAMKLLTERYGNMND